MLAKVPAKRRDTRSSFASLNKYLSGDKLERETGEIIRSANDVQIDTNCLSAHTASAEMRAIADTNPRVKDPVYHCILSWQAGENPTDAQMFEAARAAQNSVGMDAHQYVYAIHRDTDNAHVHMMVNRVHPDTAKSVYPDRDFFKLDKCMRECELTQGWAHDKGPHEVKNGHIVRAERSSDTPPLPTKAKDFEAVTGHESLITYAQSVKVDALEAVKKGNWQELHSVLRKHGLEIKEAGQGFKIYSLADKTQTPIKASDMDGALGGGKLKKALGAYEKPLRVVTSEKPERTYQSDPAEREHRREERAVERAILKQQHKEECTAKRAEAGGRDAKSEYARLREGARAVRERIRSEGYDKPTTKYLLSIAAMEAVQQRESLKKSLAEERNAKRPPGYRTWVADRAEAGDKAAIAQLKGWQYQDSRKRAAAEKSEREEAARGALKGSDQQSTELVDVTAGICWKVDRSTGDVTYQQAGRDLLRDTGKQVSVLDQQSDQAITAGLMLASQKFGSTLTLTGSSEFQRRTVEIAVLQHMHVKFLDQAAEQYRLQLIQQQGQGNGISERTAEAEKPIQAHRQSIGAPDSLVCRSCSQAMWTVTVDCGRRTTTAPANRVFCGPTREMVWEQGQEQNKGVIGDCSAYLAFRGRSDEDAEDDVPVTAKALAAVVVQAGVIEPAASETFGRFA